MAVPSAVTRRPERCAPARRRSLTDGNGRSGEPAAPVAPGVPVHDPLRCPRASPRRCSRRVLAMCVPGSSSPEGNQPRAAEDTVMQTQTMRLRELTVRYSLTKTDAGRPVIVGRAMNSPRDSAGALMAVLQNQPTEVFATLCLTTKHRVIAYHEVSRGTLDSTYPSSITSSSSTTKATPGKACRRRAALRRRSVGWPELDQAFAIW